jgi:hypothetical protein
MQRAKILGIATAGMLALAASPSVAFETSTSWNDHSWSFDSPSEKQYKLNQAREIEFFEGGGFNHTTNNVTNSKTYCKAGEEGAFTGGCASKVGVQSNAIGSQNIIDQSNDININGDNNSAFADNSNDSNSTNSGDVTADGTQVNAENDGDVNLQ